MARSFRIDGALGSHPVSGHLIIRLEPRDLEPIEDDIVALQISGLNPLDELAVDEALQFGFESLKVGHSMEAVISLPEIASTIRITGKLSSISCEN
jgi:hypothetical protein